jgi:predicted RNase H-like nuclease (RuvC/YqgF family)
MTDEKSEQEPFLELTLTVEQARWFIERLQEELDQANQENYQLKNQLAMAGRRGDDDAVPSR